MMKSAIILVLLVAAIGLVTARPELDVLRAVEIIEEKETPELVQIISNAEDQVARKPACCNQCGACDRRAPEVARCQCLDLVRQCHPSCVRCVQAKVLIYPPLYQCLDMDNMAYKDCHRKCNRAATASKFIN